MKHFHTSPVRLAATRQGLFFLFVTLLFPCAAGAVETGARHWLERMIDAVHDLDYEGVFVYLHGRQLESFRLEHTAAEGGERARLISLNGSPRVINRDAAALVCIMPDLHQVMVDRDGEPSVPVLGRLGRGELPKQYRVQLLGSSRIAARLAQVVGVIPEDDYRYGYRLYLDRDTALPLKLDLMDERARPLEQVMFTVLEVHGGHRGATMGKSRENKMATVREDAPVSSRWRFKAYPPGFRVRYREFIRRGDGPPVEHVVVSDGLASVSFYIEPDDGKEKRLSGEASIGAVNAWGGERSGYQITAVGEVPQKTIRELAEALELGTQVSAK